MSFNLTLEILIVDRDCTIQHRNPFDFVSISHLRFLSLIGVCGMDVWTRMVVSISHLRFLSLIVLSSNVAQGFWYRFNLTLEILIVDRNGKRIQMKTFKRFNLTLEILIVDRFKFSTTTVSYLLVSISHLRFLSLIDVFYQIFIRIPGFVSISHLRFLSLIVSALFPMLPIFCLFQSHT